MVLVGCPGIECGNEGRQREGLHGPRRVILREHKAGGIGRELSQCDSTNVAALLQLAHMLCHRIVQLQLALLVGQCEERGIEDLADRPEIEQHIGGDRLGPVGHAIIEERNLPIRLLPTPPTCRVLPGSGVKLCVGRCGDVARDAEQGTEGVERIEPPVEAEGEFVEVGLQVLVTDPVMDAVQPRFQVCEDEMDDWQILLGDLRIAPFSDGEVFVAALGKAGVAAPGRR